MLRGPNHPRVLVCANDEIALGAITAAEELGLDVPGDVAITGWDDVMAARHARPGLTTVRQPMRQLGARAARRLHERLTGDTSDPRHEVLPTQLVLRASCGQPPQGGSVSSQMTTVHHASTRSMRHTTWVRLGVSAAVVGLVLTGCGRGSEGGTAADTGDKSRACLPARRPARSPSGRSAPRATSSARSRRASRRRTRRPRSTSRSSRSTRRTTRSPVRSRPTRPLT